MKLILRAHALKYALQFGIKIFKKQSCLNKDHVSWKYLKNMSEDTIIILKVLLKPY